MISSYIFQILSYSYPTDPPENFSVWHNGENVTGKTFAVEEGETVNVSASVEGNPDPAVTWARAGAQERENGRSLTITDIRRAESTYKYNCTAENEAGSKSVNFEIDVLCKYRKVFFQLRIFPTWIVPEYSPQHSAAKSFRVLSKRYNFFCSVSPQSDSCCLLNGTLLILNILSVASVQETFHNLKAPKRAERVIEAMEPAVLTDCTLIAWCSSPSSSLLCSIQFWRSRTQGRKTWQL